MGVWRQGSSIILTLFIPSIFIISINIQVTSRSRNTVVYIDSLTLSILVIISPHNCHIVNIRWQLHSHQRELIFHILKKKPITYHYSNRHHVVQHIGTLPFQLSRPVIVSLVIRCLLTSTCKRKPIFHVFGFTLLYERFQQLYELNQEAQDIASSNIA